MQSTTKRRAGSKWLLQRRKLGMDCAKWRTVVSLPLSKVEAGTQFVVLAQEIDPEVAWRLVEDCPQPRKLAWIGQWTET